MNQKLWETEFDEPMPPDMTYQKFAYLRDKKWLADDINSQLEITKRIKQIPATEPVNEIARIENDRLAYLYKEKIRLEIGGFNGRNK